MSTGAWNQSTVLELAAYDGTKGRVDNECICDNMLSELGAGY